MKIKSISSWTENLELSRPYTIAFKTVDKVENCFVKIELENGIYGLGAANPSKQVVGESLSDTQKVLDQESLSWLVGRDIRHIQLLCFEISEKFEVTPGASAALDIALHDAFSQWLNVPLCQYLGQKIYSLPTSITVGIKSVAESLTEADEYLSRGFKILKIKLGKSIEEDLEVLNKLRERFGQDVLIRIDANQGYNRDELIRFVKQTESLNLELIEQPLQAGAIEDMKSLPLNIRELIAADESLLSPANAFQLVTGTKACGIFNIKLMKCGGIARAKSIAEIARQSEVNLMWGCNDESIVSITAALHAAFSCKHTKYIDLDGSLDLARDIVSGGFILEDGMMKISDSPGLGLKQP